MQPGRAPLPARSPMPHSGTSQTPACFVRRCPALVLFDPGYAFPDSLDGVFRYGWQAPLDMGSMDRPEQRCPGWFVLGPERLRTAATGQPTAEPAPVDGIAERRQGGDQRRDLVDRHGP